VSCQYEKQRGSEFVINNWAAMTLGLTIPPTLLARAKPLLTSTGDRAAADSGYGERLELGLSAWDADDANACATT
jgi:hypothetical protein